MLRTRRVSWSACSPPATMLVAPSAVGTGVPPSAKTPGSTGFFIADDLAFFSTRRQNFFITNVSSAFRRRGWKPRASDVSSVGGAAFHFDSTPGRHSFDSPWWSVPGCGGGRGWPLSIPSVCSLRRGFPLCAGVSQPSQARRLLPRYAASGLVLMLTLRIVPERSCDPAGRCVSSSFSHDWRAADHLGCVIR